MKVYLYNKELLHVLFPAFIRAPETLLPPNTKVYYIHEQGDPLKREQEIQFLYKNFILVLPTAGLADIAITNMDEAISFISNKFRIKVNQRVLGRLRKIAETDQMEFFKTSIALGRWYTEVFTRKEKVYRIFEALSRDRRRTLSVWFKLIEDYAPPALFSAILTFLLRMDTMQADREHMSDWMLDVLNRAKRQKFNIREACMPLSIKSLDFDVRVLGFLLGLRK